MKLDARVWVGAGGLTPEWKALRRRRLEESRRSLSAIGRELARRGPRAIRPGRFSPGLRLLASGRGAAVERALLHPAMDYWLYLWEKHFGVPGPDENWRLQFGLLQGSAAGCALEQGGRVRLSAVADPDAHVHLYGRPEFLELPPELALADLDLGLSPRGLELRAPAAGRRWSVSRRALESAKDGESLGEGLRLRRLAPAADGVHAAACGLLLVQGVTIHGLAKPTPDELAAFCRVLGVALAQLAEHDPPLHAEMVDLVPILIPLESPKQYGSVSSSYVNLRGAICLSHADDPLLQAETLIHEFCHQKMNWLLAADPLLQPGQSAQIFYSPWRPDARRLRGLLLGAHAFLNVAAYLTRALSARKLEERQRVSVMCNVARRLFEVDSAMRSLLGYATFTPFGMEFALELTRRLQTLFHAAQAFPARLVDEARETAQKHRALHCMPLTGVYRTADLKTAAASVAYRQTQTEAK